MDRTFRSPSPKRPDSKSSMSQELREVTSSQKLHKVLIDKFGGVHRESFHALRNFAPLVRVDMSNDKENVRQSDGQQGKRAELDHLAELREMKKIDLFRAEEDKNAKIKQIRSLIEKVQAAKMDNAELRRLVLTSNELKHRARWEKQKYQNTLKSLTIQAHEAIKKQDRELITLAHQYFLVTKQKEEVRDKIKALKEKTTSLRAEEQRLDGLIVEESNKVEQRRQTITQLNFDIKRVEAEVNVSALQISVLRMQVNPCLRVGFSTVSLDPEGDRKRILDKSYNTWPKNKTKPLSNNEIRDYLVMQLYPSWRRMLSKISSEFIGYQQLLCYEMIEGQQKLPDLSLYLPQKVQSNRNTSGKARSFIIVYSPIQQNHEEIIKIAIELGGLSNGILKIDEVRVEEVEGNLQIQINYTFMEAARTKRFEVVRLKELTRQLVMKWLPAKDDKCLLMKLQVPLIPGPQKAQYQEVYDLIRRWK